MKPIAWISAAGVRFGAAVLGIGCISIGLICDLVIAPIFALVVTGTSSNGQK